MSEKVNHATNEEINHGYYRIEVSADNSESFIEARFYNTDVDMPEIGEWDKICKDTKRTKYLSVRKIRGPHTILVRDYISDSRPKDKKNIVRIKAQEILDSIARTSLGNYTEFWVPIENIAQGKGEKGSNPPSDEQKKAEVADKPSTTENITYRAEQIDPPYEMPLINGRKLLVHGLRKYYIGRKRKVAVRVHDLKLGEFSYNTDEVIIHGVDLRVQGDKIDRNDNTIVLHPFNSPLKKDEKYLLIVKGSAMRIDGVRAENIDWVRVSNEYEIEAKVEGAANNVLALLINWWETVNLRAGFKSIFNSFNFSVLLFALAVMTWLPFGRVNDALDKYNEMRRSIMNTSVECTRPPVEVSNKLSLQMVGCSGETNSVATASTSTTGDRGVRNDSNKMQVGGGGVVTFYFVLACLLYLVLYVVVICLAVATFKSMRRHNKMTRNMSPVIEALRNERDKEKRRAMQKKILDDMIDTYLDRPSSDE